MTADPIPEWQIHAELHIYLLTFLQGFLIVLFYIQNDRILINEGRTFKMLIQAPEIQIDAANHRLLIIRNKFLGMHKARCILVDLYARLQQL